MTNEKRYYDLTYKEIAEALIVKLNIHEGLWGVRARFGIGAANAPGPEGKMVPVAMVPLISLGLQSFDEEGDLTADAAKVNPIRRDSKKSKRK